MSFQSDSELLEVTDIGASPDPQSGPCLNQILSNYMNVTKFRPVYVIITSLVYIFKQLSWHPASYCLVQYPA